MMANVSINYINMESKDSYLKILLIPKVYEVKKLECSKLNVNSGLIRVWNVYQVLRGRTRLTSESMWYGEIKFN